MKTRIASIVLAVMCASASSANARVVDCSNSRTKGVGGDSGLWAYSQSARNMSCKQAHGIIAANYIWRGGQLTGYDGVSIPHWRCATLIEWMTQKNWVLNDLEGAVNRCTSGAKAFRFTWGNKSRWAAHI